MFLLLRKLLGIFVNQARSQKSAMWGCVGECGSKDAGGNWGSAGKTSSRRRHGGLGAEPPSAKKHCIFLATIT